MEESNFYDNLVLSSIFSSVEEAAWPRGLGRMGIWELWDLSVLQLTYIVTLKKEINLCVLHM